MKLGLRFNPARLEKARDISKLAPKVIIDKNGHRKTVYVRLGVLVKKDGKVRKEP